MNTASTNWRDRLLAAAGRPEFWVRRAKSRFIQSLWDAMQAEDVNQKQLAERISTSTAYVSKILGGEQNFTIESMGKLAFALGREIRIDLAPLPRGEALITPHAKLEHRPEATSVALTLGAAAPVVRRLSSFTFDGSADASNEDAFRPGVRTRLAA